MSKFSIRTLYLMVVFGGFFIESSQAQCPNSAPYQTITYDTTIVGSGNMSFTLPLFDPSVGTLYSVTANLEAYLTYKYSLTNSKPSEEYYKVEIERRDILRASSPGNPNFQFFPTSFDNVKYIYDDIEGTGVPSGVTSYEKSVYNPRTLTNTYPVPFLGSGALTLFYQSNTNAYQGGSSDVVFAQTGVKDSIILTMTYNYCPSVSLPSKNITINSFVQSGNIVLQWSSLEHLTGGSFEILKSDDARTYTNINKQSIGQQQLPGYSFLYKPSKEDLGKAFFRVKQTDQYGNVTYSKVLTIVIPTSSNNDFPETTKSMIVYPTLAYGTINIAIPQGNNKDEWQIKIIALSGQVMQHSKFSNANQAQITLSSNLTGGMYIVEATNSRTQARHNEKIVIQRN